MYYVYVLKSRLNSELYVGSTINLKKRLIEHNNGKSFSTARYRPWKLIYYESYITEQLARNREHRLKHHGNAMRELRKRIGALPSTTQHHFYTKGKSGAGFTLLEVVVTIVILSIITLLVTSAFPEARSAQALLLARQQLRSIFQKAEQQALQEIRDENCLQRVKNNPDYTLQKRCSDIGVALQGSTALLFADTEDDNQYTEGQDYLLSTLSLPAGVKVTQADGTDLSTWQSFLFEATPPTIDLYVNQTLLPGNQQAPIALQAGRRSALLNVNRYGRLEQIPQ